MAPYPCEWKAEKDAIVEQNDKFLECFEANFVVGENLSVSKQIAEELLQPAGKQNIRDELKRMGLTFKYDSQEYHMICGERHKGFFHGFGAVDEPENQAMKDARITGI